MNPRPFHRSRLFWLGVPGLLFLLWLWLGTRDISAWAQWGHADQLIIAGIDTGHSRLDWTTSYSAEGRSTLAGLNWAAVEVDTAPLFPAAGRFATTRFSAGHRYTSMMLAHWLTLLLYLAVWLTTCAAWQRRKRRRITSAVPPHSTLG